VLSVNVVNDGRTNVELLVSAKLTQFLFELDKTCLWKKFPHQSDAEIEFGCVTDRKSPTKQSNKCRCIDALVGETYRQ